MSDLSIELKNEIKELEFDFQNQIQSLEGIFFNNKSAVFFDIVLIKYENNDTKKISICKWKSTRSVVDLMKVFRKYNIFYKNIVKKENVYFAVTEKTKFLNFIWLDDIKLDNISQEQLEYMTLIETSPRNYQAWIRLNKLYTKNEIQQIKHYLIEKLKADRGASSYIQPMRFPGFFSYKHQEPFYVKVYKTSNKRLNGKKILEKIKNTESVVINNSQKSNTKSTEFNDSWKKYSYYKRELGLENIEFNPSDERNLIKEHYMRKKDIKEDGIDENIIDIHYIYQLLIRDYPRDEIFLYLQQTREDLNDKHKASDYFERTYLKALLFYKLFYPEKKFYSNKDFNDYIKLQKEKGIWKEDKKVTENLQILIDNLST